MLFLYRYAAIDTFNRQRYGSIIASSEQEALDMLNRKQYQVREILCQGKHVTLREIYNELLDSTVRRISDETVLLFTRELSLMMRVGIPIDKAFQTLAGYQEDHKMRKVVETIREDIRKGSSITHSVTKHPRVFPPIYRALVEVAEQTGKLSHMLDELANYLERELDTRKKVISALTYPIFVMVSTIFIITGLMIYYIPSFTKFLSGIQVPLPLPTKMLMGIVYLFQSPGALSTIVIILVIAGYLYYNFSRTMVGRFFVDNVKINIPYIGDFLIMVRMTRFTRTFALMYRNGINISKILDASKDIVQNEPLKDILEQCKAEIIHGDSIAESFRTKKYIPSLMKSFIILGEETEDIVFSMEKIAQIYDEQIAYRIECFMNLLEPVFMAIVAVVVGFVILALFLPIYSLISNIGG
ncbi:MAG: type II secretion system F family protein [Candidatus Eremiobacteraeota bacterium]|nr:type II secretion system F family protein [Candidatus Eremiobacteraeota bacterium]